MKAMRSELEFDFETMIPIDPATVCPFGDLDFNAANRKR